MAVTKKKTTKATDNKAPNKAPDKDYKAAFEYLVKNLRWTGKCKELVEQAVGMVSD